MKKGGISVQREAQPELYVELQADAGFPHLRRGAWLAIDGDPRSEWVSVYPKKHPSLPHVDLEFPQARMVDGVSYLPRQERLTNGQVYRYVIYTRPTKEAPWENRLRPMGGHQIA